MTVKGQSLFCVLKIRTFAICLKSRYNMITINFVGLIMNVQYEQQGDYLILA